MGHLEDVIKNLNESIKNSQRPHVLSEFIRVKKPIVEKPPLIWTSSEDKLQLQRCYTFDSLEKVIKFSEMIIVESQDQNENVSLLIDYPRVSVNIKCNEPGGASELNQYFASQCDLIKRDIDDLDLSNQTYY